MGHSWPPVGVVAAHPFLLPAINTVLLLSSGVTATWAHASIIAKNRPGAIAGIDSTISLALFFTFVQYLEYKYSSLYINDSVFGSIFYLITGFHGFHVILGSVFLCECLKSYIQTPHKICSDHHFGFIAALWYWHFVDVIWIFVFFIIYIWGSW